ncbi:MAG: tripartite tricarboxylate transporter substrate binding protein [Burkholderiales bacterium]|nr:tripartite tricarboxylate transporter substrate binding protein [Burkholderiales bacterium]
MTLLSSRRRCLSAAGAAALVSLAGIAPSTALAQAYPDRPITLVVPFPPGGPTDSSARVIARALGARLGQQIVVDNRAGAGGTVGPGSVVKASADGYTLLWAGTSSLAMGPAIYRKLSYDPINSFTPISQVVRSPLILVGRPDLPAGTLKEVVAAAKAQPGKLSYGSAGGGSATHLTGELFEATYGIDLLHVGYRGGASALTDLIGKQTDLLFETVPPLMQHIKAGAVKAYAVTGVTRSPLLPDVPTFAELLGGDFESYSWFGLVAPAGTPRPIVDRLVAELRVVLADGDLRKQLNASGFDVLGTTPEEFRRVIATDLQKWTSVVKRTGITLD